MDPQVTTAREYLRVSYDRSGRAKSVTEQHGENEQACARHGWAMGDSYNDLSVSASRYSKKARKGYDRLVADLEGNTFQADILILWESSRGSREVAEWVTLIELCTERNMWIYVTSHNRSYDPSNPRDRRSLLEDAVDSQYESEKLSQRLSRSGAADAQAGKPPPRNAFGHPRNNIVDGYRVPVPAEQIDREREAIKKLYEGLFAGKTLVKLGRELDEAGFATAQGNTFGRSGARAVLRNPRNAGIRYYWGERVADGNWDPIVSEETWQAAVQLLANPKRRKNQTTARRWLGGGLYRCGQCGDSTMRVNYDDEQARVYRCRIGGHNTRRAEKIDAYVRAVVAERLRQEDIVTLLGPDTGEKVAALHADAAVLRTRQEGLADDYADGTLSKSQMRAANERLTTRLTQIEDRLADIGRRNRLADLLSRDHPANWFLDAEVDVQRATVDAICTVTVLPNRRGRWADISETVRVEPRSDEPVE